MEPALERASLPVNHWQAPHKARLPTEREAWTAANIVIEEHGVEARDHANRRIAELTEAGDEKGVQTWRLILDRIEQLQTTHGRRQ